MELIGGVLVMLGGGLLTSAGLMMRRAEPRSAAVVATLSFSPLPLRDRALEQLMRDAGAALDGHA